MSNENQSSADDRQLPPTAQRLQRARTEGDVVYSMEITVAATYAAFYVVVIMAGGWSLAQVTHILSTFLRRPEDIGAALLSPRSGYFERFIVDICVAMAPVFGALALATIASLVTQQAVTFSLKKIKPKLSRLSIIDNAKQKYGPDGLFEFAKNAAKLTAVIAILVFGLKDRIMDLPELTLLPAQAFPSIMQREAALFLGLVTLAAVLIAAIDLPWKIAQHRKKLMMTHEEVRKESRESEGDPAMKGARRERANAIARNRMMADVPTANVVIVNPTHYAVALKWDREKGAAPVCVAKGVDAVAARIREVAAEAGVPIRRDPPTARSIFAAVDIGREIKREHYAAVAAAIHYADEIAKKAKQQYAP